LFRLGFQTGPVATGAGTESAGACGTTGTSSTIGTEAEAGSCTRHPAATATLSAKLNALKILRIMKDYLNLRLKF
jgi:hypothetical protein